ncbi:MAG: TIGR02206 family membrane protein [Acholeplasmataceae bacterium]|nr:MAG: TIGR02206 family membrane protein [Acholeplasmataceae bacterium]
MFFFDDRFETFAMFSVSHVLALLVLASIAILIVRYRHVLAANPRLDKRLRIGVACTMVVMEWVFYVWSISRGGFTYDLLPLGLCAMSMYLTAILLVVDKEKLFKVIYPWAITGAFLSLMVATTTFNFPHFRYMHYFGNHGLFLLAMLYYSVVRRYRMTYHDTLKSSLILFLIAIPIYVLNIVLKTNHLFLAALPDGFEGLTEAVGSPLWLIIFVLMIFGLFNLWHLPFLKKTNLPSKEVVDGHDTLTTIDEKGFTL